MAKEKSNSDSINVSRESAADVLAELRNTYGSKAGQLSEVNEAVTRLLIIDKVLESVGWKKEEFNPETPVKNVGFTDYLLSIDHIPKLVVEAKRVGQTFVGKTGLKKLDYSLSFIKNHFNRAVTEVIKQAESYAKAKGVPFALITNGAEWILFQVIPVRENTINDLKCFYFGNLLNEHNHFDAFWDLVSRDNVSQESLHEQFSSLNSLSYEVCNLPKTKLDSPGWEINLKEDKNIKDFYDRFFGEIVDPKRNAMLRRCFVSSPKLDQYEGELKKALRDQAPSFIENAEELEPDYENENILDIETGDQKGRLVLVVGSIGSGKTTLVTKVISETKNSGSGRADYIVIDFINEFDEDPNEVPHILMKKILEKWNQMHREYFEFAALQKIFGHELSQLKKGGLAKIFQQQPDRYVLEEGALLDSLAKDTEKFLKKSFRYNIGTKKRGIVLFLDNIDRTSDRYQRAVYTFAHKFSNETGSKIIITMREGTYFRGKKDFLDVRSSDLVYHLQAPDPIQVLAKRVSYVENLEENAEGEYPDLRLRDWRRKPNWQDFHAKSLKYSGVIKRTFLNSSSGSAAIDLLSAVAWHNIRYFFVVMREIHQLLSNEEDFWTITEIITALLAPVNGKPTLPNLYYPVAESYATHFLKIRILMRLIYGRHHSDLKRGTSFAAINNFTIKYCYLESWTKTAIKDMVRERLLECLEIPTESDYTKDYEFDNAHTFRVSPLAIVLLKEIYVHPIYLLFSGINTPFHKSSSFENLINATTAIFSILCTEESINKSSIELLLESGGDKVFSSYLAEIFLDEMPIGNPEAYYSEINNAEEKVKELIVQLRKLAGIDISSINPSKNKPKKAIDGQMTLELSIEFMAPNNNILEIKPMHESFQDVHIYTRELEPKIYWAMVQLRKQGKEEVSGAEIAQMINQFTDDLNRVESSNISKALRGKNMNSKVWLRRNQINGKTRFRLSDNWRIYWGEYMKGEPPY
jgi:Cdc6-like AAA superfamily ATPase